MPQRICFMAISIKFKPKLFTLFFGASTLAFLGGYALTAWGLDAGRITRVGGRASVTHYPIDHLPLRPVKRAMGRSSFKFFFTSSAYSLVEPEDAKPMVSVPARKTHFNAPQE